MVGTHKLDTIRNALLIGMALDDAFIYAGCSPEEMLEIKDNDELMSEFRQYLKRYEFTLLSKLNDVIDKQVHMGREAAVTWALEKLYPRYASKPQKELPDIHMHFDNTDPAEYDTVEIVNQGAMDVDANSTKETMKDA